MLVDYLRVFITGGVICALVQLLMEKTKMMPGRIMVLLVCSCSYFLILELHTRDAKNANTSDPLIPTAEAVKPPVKSPKNP